MVPKIKHKFVRDPVHGFIGFPEDLYDTLIDTPLFQRLREIRQLALSHLVYPGANHTRFEHSLGVAHVVKRMIESVQINTREHVIPYIDKVGIEREYVEEVLNELNSMTKEAVVAALLHDIGHVALSHVFDKSLEDWILMTFEKKYVPSHRNHEERTVNIVVSLLREGIMYDGEKVDMELVKSILDEAYGKEEGGSDAESGGEMGARENALKIVAQMISSDIDADRGDYILRDSYFSGAVSQIYDIGRLYNVIALVPERQGSKTLKLGVIEKGASVIENMLLGRIYMYKDVYLHSVAMIYSAMASRFLSLVVALGDKLSKEIPEVKYARKVFWLDSPELKDSLLSFTDSTFFEMLRKVSCLDIDKVVEDLKGSEKEKVLEGLKALKALAKGILGRRHWSAFILHDASAARLAAKMDENKSYFVKLVKGYLNPFVIFYWNSYTAYKGNVPLFDRSKPRVRMKLHESQTSTIADRIMGVRYAKVTIVFPKVYEELDSLVSWRVKRGKYEPEAAEAEEARKAFDLAKGLAKELIDWTT